MRRILAALAAVFLGAASPALSDVVQRAAAPAGSVIARKVGEEVLFVDLPPWRSVDVQQDLLPGDILRTNAKGHLAVLFSDHTQIRIARNSTLVVKQIGGGQNVLTLQEGSVWARAERGGEELTIETPAAAAAVRGTDWSMTVEGGKTSVIVLEGRIDFYNELGSVSVAEGEAAVATIGQAPAKVVLVDPDDREQMLFYLTLRNAFNWMPASPLPSPEMRRQRDRIRAMPDEARTGEDWLTLAEVSLSYEGKQAAAAAARQARQLRLSPSQQARLDLIDALLIGAANQYVEAARLFDRAAPRLDQKRRAIALYGGYFARGLADPERAENPPSPRGGGPYAALAEAWTVGFLKDIPSAIDVVRRAEARYPDDPTLPAYRAQLAILIDDREQVKSAIARALSIDPDDPTALEARAHHRAGYEGNLEDAYLDITRAAAIAPGSTTIWNALGNIQSARKAEREAEAAYKRSIELDPEDPVSYANLGLFYLEQDRVAEAKVLIDKALAVDPSFDLGLIARGRYHLQTGQTDKAIQDLLAGSTANPAYAQGLLLLGAGYYEQGDRDPAEQAIENANRLDPNDPMLSSVVTAIAIDDYDSDLAIESAQETLRRARARGGDLGALTADRDSGSLLNEAFRLQGLDAWGRYYGDLAFDPFAGTGYVDQSLAGSVDSFALDLDRGSVMTDPEANALAFSALFQGLLLDPMMLAGRSRTANLFRRPFVEGQAGGGVVSTEHGHGWTAEGQLQGHLQGPVPWSFYANVAADRTDDFRSIAAPEISLATSEFNLNYENVVGAGYITAKPTPYDRFVAYVDVRRSEPDILDGLLVADAPIPFVLGTIGGLPVDGAFLGSSFDRTIDDVGVVAGAGWSHTFGHRNVMNAAFFATGLDRSTGQTSRTLFDIGVPLIAESTTSSEIEQRTYVAAVGHAYGVGDVTFRYGVEGGRVDLDSTTSTISAVIDPVVIPLDPGSETTELGINIARTYMDVLYDVTPDLKVEAALFGSYADSDQVSIDSRLEPRAGIAWAPVEGHWLRAGYLRESAQIAGPTLAPIGVVGLQAGQLPYALDGLSDTYIARWDAEWTSRFFTTVDYQHQVLENLLISVPASNDSLPVTAGTLDRFSATANVWLGHGFGAFGSIAYLESENETPGFSGPLPFVPETLGRVGMTWVNPANVKVTVAATYVGERAGNLAGVELDDYWTADAFLTWEPLDKQLELNLAAYNMFDQDFEVAPGVEGWGRTFVGSLKVRF